MEEIMTKFYKSNDEDDHDKSSNSIGDKDRHRSNNKFNDGGDRDWSYKSDTWRNYKIDDQKVGEGNIYWKILPRWKNECGPLECFLCKGPHLAQDCSMREKLKALINLDGIEENKSQEEAQLRDLRSLNAKARRLR